MKSFLNIKDSTAKSIILILFCLSLLLVMVFHEPWFDEAQVWMIARDASLYEIFFVMPHYEGHPALWSLLLAVPAKLGIPFELSLKSIGFIITSVSAYLIIYKSPFPKYIKYCLPFSFFFFYQGGVIVRPYSLMILVLLLLGLNFKDRNRKPFLYISLLFLLCCTSAYGIVFAGGIALCIVGELVNEKGLKRFISELLVDKRTLCLILLLIGAILLILQIYPYPDTYIPSEFKRNSFLIRLLCTLFTVIGDCFFTRSLWFYYDRTLLQIAAIPWYSLLSCIAVGIIIWILIYCVSDKTSFVYFLVPYLLFSVFASEINFNGHHLICPFALFLFWLWIAYANSEKDIGWDTISIIFFPKESDRKLLVKFSKIFVAICVVFSTYWTIHSSVLDFQKEYSFGRNASAFLKENKLDNAYIVAAWESASIKGERIDYLNMIGTIVPINAYLKKNIAFNLNGGDPDKGYAYLKKNSKEEKEELISLIKEKGLPDVLVGKPNLDLIFDEDAYETDYTIVYYMPVNYIWKADAYRAYITLSLRNDLLETHNLSEAPLPQDISISSFELTEEQFRLYNEGKITLEDIVGSN